MCARVLVAYHKNVLRISWSTGTVLVGNWPALRILDLSANKLEGALQAWDQEGQL